MQSTAELITGSDFRRMITGAYKAFMCEYEHINNLNVFPVPDGDTGTNMLLTLRAVARTLEEAPDGGIGSLSKRAADSAIMGARGNSGVILSQIFRGIARGLAGKEQANSAEVGKAFQYGVLYAYRAVSQPVEGTILTVAKGIAKGAHLAVRQGLPFADIISQAIAVGEKELARTPDLLPALKAAGVVDAGGKGLIVFLAGCLEGLGGTYTAPEADFGEELTFPAAESGTDIAHPYCTEFIIKDCRISIGEARQTLLSLGDSLVLAEGAEVVKVHIHTAHPGMVLESAITWGTLHDIKIENMADQHSGLSMAEQAVPADGPQIPLAVISAVSGDGLAAIMRELGAAIIIAGGQTMNPPVEDFVAAVHHGNAEKYIILPNNKNIALTAVQVKKLLGDRVEIVPTANVPQGMAALLAFNAADSLQANVARMTDLLPEVKAAAITVAVRDSVADGRQVRAGAFIGVVDNQVVVDAADLSTVLYSMVQKLVTPADEAVTLYYGADLDKATAGKFADELDGKLKNITVETYYGGQPYYQFIISVE